MHPYLMWNIGPPLWWSIVIGCLCLLTKTFFALPMYWLICVLAFHSNVSAVPISGCLRRLLLLLFIKLDFAPLVWCCLIHPKDLNRSFILCIILRIVLSLIVRIVPTPSRLSISHKLASSWNNTLQVMLSPVFMEIIQSSRHASHSLQWKVLCCKLNVLLHGFFSACQIKSWKEKR